MERFAFIFVAGVLFCGGAQASSIVSLEATDEPVGPSMIVIGGPAEPAMVKEEMPSGVPTAVVNPGDAEDAFAVASPSIVSMAAMDGTVSDEKVAAVGEPEDAPGNARVTPMVIRGGIVGDAFARTIDPASIREERQTASAQSSGQDASEQPADATPPPPGSMPELSLPR